MQVLCLCSSFRDIASRRGPVAGYNSIKELGHVSTSCIRIMHQSWDIQVLCSLFLSLWAMIPHAKDVPFNQAL